MQRHFVAQAVEHRLVADALALQFAIKRRLAHPIFCATASIPSVPVCKIGISSASACWLNTPNA